MGGCWHLRVPVDYKRRGSQSGVIQSSVSPRATSTWTLLRTTKNLFSAFRRIKLRMQTNGYGYAPLYYQSSRCSAPTKPPSGKSFTIEALLAKPDPHPSSDRTSPLSCGIKYPAAPAPVLPIAGQLPSASYVYSHNVLHPAVHTQPGYSVYCCPPFSYGTSCRNAFYAQGQSSFNAFISKHALVQCLKLCVIFQKG